MLSVSLRLTDRCISVLQCPTYALITVQYRFRDVKITVKLFYSNLLAAVRRNVSPVYNPGESRPNRFAIQTPVLAVVLGPMFCFVAVIAVPEAVHTNFRKYCPVFSAVAKHDSYSSSAFISSLPLMSTTRVSGTPVVLVRLYRMVIWDSFVTESIVRDTFPQIMPAASTPLAAKDNPMAAYALSARFSTVVGISKNVINSSFVNVIACLASCCSFYHFPILSSIAGKICFRSWFLQCFQNLENTEFQDLKDYARYLSSPFSFFWLRASLK